MQKTLIILRHAKTETSPPPGKNDHARVLIERGVEASRLMGTYLKRQHIVPDKILCSTAARAKETWKHVQETYKKKLPVEYNDKLYLASANEILKQLSATPESVHSLLVIGHNPGLHQLCLKLAKKGDEESLELLALKFPTCALAAITLNGSWRDITHARGELKLLTTPKQLSGSL